MEPERRLQKGGNDESPYDRPARGSGGHRDDLLWGCAHSDTQAGEPRTAREAIRDASITAAVKLSLAFERGVRATDVHVDTDRGRVTLEGEVRTQAERQLAVKVAEDVEGVKDVVDRIRVRG